MADSSKSKQQDGHGQKQQEKHALMGNGGSRARSLSPYSGGSPLSRFRGEFDRLFDNFFGGWPAMNEFMQGGESR